MIIFRLCYVYALIYFVGASYFIIVAFIYLFCCLSVVLQELPTLPEYNIHPFLVAQSKFPVECFVHLFHSPVFFWPLYCLSFDLHHILTLWYLQTFLIICLYQTGFLSNIFVFKIQINTNIHCSKSLIANIRWIWRN